MLAFCQLLWKGCRLKLSTQKDVFLDTVTGMHYERPFVSKRALLLDETGNAPQAGHTLKPCGGHPDLDWSLWEKNEGRPEVEAALGYAPDDYAQTLFVTDALLASRFKFVGRLNFEQDMAQQVKKYEEENVDFSNRDRVGGEALCALSKDSGGLAGAALYTVVREYLARTELAKGPVFLAPAGEAANADLPGTVTQSKENW